MARLSPADAVRSAAIGLRIRPLRSVLSALGIAIGIGAMVAVLGLSESSKSDLLAQLDRLGTNLLRVEAVQGIGLGSAELPAEAPAMISRIRPVDAVSSVGELAGIHVYRSDLVPASRTGGIVVRAADPDLLATRGGPIAEGRFLAEGTDALPVVVLGSVAAGRLGVTTLDRPQRVWLGDRWWAVTGILDVLDLAPDLDRSALVGYPAAERFLALDPIPTTIFVRTDPAFVDEVRSVLAATADPENPDQVRVSRPSDVLEAREAAATALTDLFLGLGAVALVVGGVGIANVMVISVLERRGEIGLRRALGATRRHIAVQFLGESLLLAGTGGVVGVALGAGVTAAYAAYRGWGILVPDVALVGGVAAAVGIGTVAGLYPALRAARVSPTDALRTL